MRRQAHSVLALFEAVRAHAVQDGHAGRPKGLMEQNRLQEDLVDPMGGLRRRPPAVRTAHIDVPLGPAGDVDPRQLEAGGAGAEHHVVRIGVRQARLADVGDESQATERLHGPGRDMVALDAGGLARRPLLDHYHIDPAPRQVHGEAQPYRAAADDRDAGGGASHDRTRARASSQRA